MPLTRTTNRANNVQHGTARTPVRGGLLLTQCGFLSRFSNGGESDAREDCGRQLVSSSKEMMKWPPYGLWYPDHPAQPISMPVARADAENGIEFAWTMDANPVSASLNRRGRWFAVGVTFLSRVGPRNVGEAVFLGVLPPCSSVQASLWRL